ncbi:DUF4838 domain-containing protein [Paenibacillus eucommiae]|uniref:Chitodextrinase n=1 Tax=Paenibacillus eucommiae TaxID=1355755 RepID=A0ABS4J862_9BACL|nr:DUF4838 domain-containing protein [Paenibacillus eucommiae]MBP1996042.1 chitodextrinase [Paenibacillus eucommiae]
MKSMKGMKGMESMKAFKVKNFLVITVMFVLMACVSTSAAFAADPEPLTIISNGTSEYVIEVRSNATQVELTAADELQDYLEQVSGVTLPIVPESGTPDKSFLIGPTAFAVTNGVNPTGEEEWAIKRIDNKIIITGGSQRGTLYGVYHFLEDVIGVRWWNIWEEYVPSESVIQVDQLDLAGEPAFGYRDMYINAFAYISSNTYILNDPTVMSDIKEAHSNFYVRNRLNGQFGFAPAEYGGTVSFGPPYFVHTASWYFNPADYIATHPEYFATVGGVPGGQLCLENTELQNLFAEKLIDHIENSYLVADQAGLPRPTMFDISQNDAHGGVCAGSTNQYDDTTLNLMFVNNIADKVALVYPEVKIETLAYMHYIDPPATVVPRDNVVIRFADLDRDNLHSLSHPNNSQTLSKLNAWQAISNELMVWQYGIDFQASGPLPSMYTYKEDFQLYRNLGMTGIFFEDESPITKDMWDMKVWMQAKLMENPDLNLEDLMTDFTDGYYGPAGSYVMEYLEKSKELADETTQRNDYFTTRTAAFSYFTADFVAWAQAKFDSAEQLVENDPVLLRRLNHARSSLDRLIILKYLDFAKDASENNIDLQAANVSRKKSAIRLIQTLNDQKALRFESSTVYAMTGSYAGDADAEINLYQSYTTLEDPVYRDTADGVFEFHASDLRLWMAPGYGMSIVSDVYSPTQSAVKVTFADLTPERRAMFEPLGSGAPFPVGIYNVATAETRNDTGVSLDLSSSEYKLYKIYDSIPLNSTDFIYIYPAWVIQKDLDVVVTEPGLLYDVYVSVRAEGPTFGGAGADALYLDKLVFVVDNGGALPSELAGIPQGDIHEYASERFNLYTPSGGVKLVNDEDSLTKRAARVKLADFATEQERALHYVTENIPMPFGLYNPLTQGNRFIKDIYPGDIVPDEYKLYKIDDVTFTVNDYLYLFRSWNVSLPLEASLRSDPNQHYDIYVSMKFQGEAYGGDSSKDDAVFIDRIFIVKTDPEEPEVPLSAPGELAGVGSSDSSISLTWTAPANNTNIAGYNVYRNDEKVNMNTVTGTTYQDAGLSADTTYSYYVKAYDVSGTESAASNTISVKTQAAGGGNGGTPETRPAAPVELAGTATSASAISLTWTAPANNANITGYNVYRNNEKVNMNTVTGTTYQDTGLSADTTYNYYVKAYDLSGTESEASSTISVKTLVSQSSGGNVNNGNNGVSSGAVLPKDGEATIPSGAAGKVNLGKMITISVPAGAADTELKLTIKEVLETAKLLSEQDVLLSPIFEVLKNIKDDFKKPVTLSIVFNPKSLKDNQTAAIFYYDESKKLWVKVGGQVQGDVVTASVDHFTKFAVFAVDKPKVITEEEEQNKTFLDIAGHWAEAGIQRAIAAGMINGYLDGSFKPDHAVTRAEFTVMLVNALKIDVEAEPVHFTDKDAIGDWAESAIAQAAHVGLIHGYEDGSFRPNDPINRAQMAVIIANALGNEVAAPNAASGFADEKDIPAWAKGAVNTVNQLGIIQGRSGNQFVSNAAATRAEAITVLLRMLDLKDK